MTKPLKNNATKIYCERCDLIFGSREKFELHFNSHSSNIASETCPIDTAIEKFLNVFRRKSS